MVAESNSEELEIQNVRFADQMLQVMRVRSSCRYFERNAMLNKEERSILERAIDCGPSAGGIRPYSVYFVTSIPKKLRVQEACGNQLFIADAYMLFCISITPEKSVEKYGERGTLYAIQDATIAGMNLIFAATALGLGSCWVGSIDTEKIKKIYRLPEGMIPLSIICIGRWRGLRSSVLLRKFRHEKKKKKK